MRSVEYRPWRAGDRVSIPWFQVLTAARRDGIAFTLTDGHRTLAEQADRYAVYKRFGRPLAARPSATAPHIRTGRIDHAIDVNALDGGAGRLAAWLRRKGAHATFPVPGEAWHLEVPRIDLERLAREVSDPLAGFPDVERQLLHSYDGLVRLKHAGRDTAEAAESRSRLRRLMTARRKAIWHAAQTTGWHKLNRSARYAALKSRTR